MIKYKAIILAGGKGTRMNSELPKVLHKIYDKCMVDYLYTACKGAGYEDIYVIIGHKADMVKEHLKETDVTFCLQEEQLGTGHAVMQAEKYIEDNDIVLVINGDQPLISSETINSLTTFVTEGNYGGAVLSATIDEPGLLGRIIRDKKGNLARIVERKDCLESEEKIKEVNVGAYCFKGELLKKSLSKLDDNNAQNEYYITDIPAHIMNMGYNFGVYPLSDTSEFQGINSRTELSIATSTLLNSCRKKHMANGVTLIDPNNTYISLETVIGKDTIIYPGTHIQGKTIIGKNCVIGPNSHIISSTIGDNVSIETSKIENSNISSNSKIGPFAHLRPNTNVDENCKVGSFVETKNTSIGSGSKVPHLIYVGDSDIGKNVEIACGVITANMNTKYKKNRTVIKDNAFIGANSTLVAPLTVEEYGTVGAGSVVTDDVKKSTLVVTRAAKNVKENYRKEEK